MTNLPPLILARLAAVGPAEVARRVAPAWGLAPHNALERLSRYKAHLEGRGGRDMSSEALFALLSHLDLELRSRA